MLVSGGAPCLCRAAPPPRPINPRARAPRPAPQVGVNGVQLIDLGVACTTEGDDAVNAAAGAEPPLKSSANSGGACWFRCKVTSGGTPGYIAAHAIADFLPPGKEQCARPTKCTAAERNGIDLFAVGASLLELLSAEHTSIYGGLRGDSSNLCPSPTDDAAKKRVTRRFVGALARFFWLDDAEVTDWAPTGAAAAASRARVYTYLLSVASARRRRSILGASPPMAHFQPDLKLPPTNLKIPRCYTGEPAAGFAALYAETLAVNDAIITLVPAPGAPLARPAPWRADAVEPHMLVPPTTSRALAPLLDLVRKLLAFRRDKSYSSPLEVVRDIDAIRKILAEELADANARTAASARIDCFAAATADNAPRPQPQPQAQPQAQAPAPAQAQAQQLSAADCRAAAALAMEQIEQRDKTPVPADGAARRPNAYDVAVALRACDHRAAPDPPPALLQLPAFGAIVRRHACLPVVLAKPLLPSAPPATRIDAPNGGAAPIFEKLPFALDTGGVWRQRDISLKCDVLGGPKDRAADAAGLGVWVHWSGGRPGMGYVVAAHDTNAGAQPPYACARRWLKAVEGARCKALALRYATQRSSENAVRPREGLLKLFTETADPPAAPAPAQGAPPAAPSLLSGAIQRFNDANCRAAADFSRLLAAAAANREQPENWSVVWTAVEVESGPGLSETALAFIGRRRA